MKTPISLRLLYLNFGHFIDHMLMLIFAKAAFSAGIDFGLGKEGAYAEMIFYGIPNFLFIGLIIGIFSIHPTKIAPTNIPAIGFIPPIPSVC